MIHNNGREEGDEALGHVLFKGVELTSMKTNRKDRHTEHSSIQQIHTLHFGTLIIIFQSDEAKTVSDN